MSKMFSIDFLIENYFYLVTSLSFCGVSLVIFVVVNCLRSHTEFTKERNNSNGVTSGDLRSHSTGVGV